MNKCGGHPGEGVADNSINMQTFAIFNYRRKLRQSKTRAFYHRDLIIHILCIEEFDAETQSDNFNVLGIVHSQVAPSVNNNHGKFNLMKYFLSECMFVSLEILLKS